ncbi:disulfide isomerase [Helicobacter sp. faydin-H20]|uniref:disulfide isomerase n=1 Tax=Helicobacter anatolicus TaxID=2905874 RepID=UPI001E2B4265|nr:disulfide isomerase [Helicobacter anatolicus]MCE3037344.1 disulfide isomerase [Helicobacter anatolicus]
MYKIFVIFVFIFGSLLQANTTKLEENLKKLIQDKTQQKITIDDIKDLKSDSNLKIVILKDSISKNQIPVITNKDGNMLFVLTNVFFAKDDNDTKLVAEVLQKIQMDNDKQINSASLNKLFESIPEDYVIKLQSSKKDNKKITYIVSDPMCPHCQDELRHIEDRLKDSNVHMVLVAYMGQESIKKAATILEKIRNAKDTKAKVDIIQQVYSTTFKATKADEKEVKKVENITKKIADSALIKGVPFIYEYK